MVVVEVVEISFALKNPAPEISENGEPGPERGVQLELKILADVGLVGFHLLESQLCLVSSLQLSQIGAYRFTTLIVPNLGMVSEVHSQVNLLQ